MERQFPANILISVSLVVLTIWCSMPAIGQSVSGLLDFKSEHGLVILPENVTGVRFTYDGLNLDSLMGDTLDLSLITEAFIYPDAVRHNFDKATLDEFEVNSVSFTDALLKWQIESLKKTVPGFVEYDTIRTNWQGKTVVVPDLSQLYILEFADSCNLDSIESDFDSINEIIFAEKVPVWKND